MPAPEKPAGVHADAVWNAAEKVWRDDVYWFDESAASKAVDFFSTHLVLTDGEWSGRPFILEKWQANDIIRPLFGWKRKDGTRRYRRCYVWVARKNGKTELAAGVAILILVGDSEQGGQVYSLATNKDQATLVFDKATVMVVKSDTLSGALECLKPSIYCPELNAAFKPLSGKPTGKHGLSVSGLIGDEIHEWVSGEAYQFLHDSESARRQPLEFLISTAGKKGTYGEEAWNECQKILDGTVDDPETLVISYAADPDDDWTSPEVWKKANPNLGVSKKIEFMEAECRRAMQLPRLVNGFKNYQLNIWTDQATLWLPLKAVDDTGREFGWDSCAGPTGWRDMEDRLAGKRCFGGLDLSAVQDLSALVWWFPIQDGLDVPCVLTRFFKPGDLIKKHGKRDKLDYDRWVQEGALIATPGNVVDYSVIRERIFEDAHKFEVAYAGQHGLEKGLGAIATDPWNATQLSIELQEDGLPVVFIRQGMYSLAGPSAELERLVLSNGFHHGGHPVLRRHATVVAVVSDENNNIRPAKNKSTERIDGIAALVNSLAIAVKNNGSPLALTPWDTDPDYRLAV